MILNEDYFKDLDIKDEDIVTDDNLDVEKPNHELTLEEAKKLPEQYDYCIRISIYKMSDSDTTFTQTILLPRLFKRLDTIFELYGIDHSEYVLTSFNCLKDCNTTIKFGDYQVFCDEYEENKYINDTYNYIAICAYVNYPKFTYKRAFRFLYTMINLYRNCKQIDLMNFELNTTNDYVIELTFLTTEDNLIGFHYYNIKANKHGNEIILCEGELTEYYKIEFYKSVFRHFFGEKVKKSYKVIDRDVPFKPIRPR